MSSVLAHAIPVGEIEVLAIDAWRAPLLARAQAGARPVIVYGRREAAGVVLTAVHQDGARLVVARTSVDRIIARNQCLDTLIAHESVEDSETPLNAYLFSTRHISFTSPLVVVFRQTCDISQIFS